MDSALEENKRTRDDETFVGPLSPQPRLSAESSLLQDGGLFEAIDECSFFAGTVVADDQIHFV